MCFSAAHSLAFALVGTATAAILRWRGRSWKYVSIAAYFAAMEWLQLLQYQVVGDCDSKFNQLLTFIAYIHTSFQPFVWNEFVWGLPQPSFNKPIISRAADPILHFTVRRLALASSCLLLLKGLPALLQLLGLAGSPLLPQLLGQTLAAYLTGPHTGCPDAPELMCGERLCSIVGKHHVGWSVPSLPGNYYVPTAYLHGFWFFVPALVLGDVPQIALASAAFVTGPLISELIVWGDARAHRYEWAAIWCMLSLGQVLILFVVELTGAKVLMGAATLPPCSKDESMFLTLLPSREEREAADGGGHADQNGAAALGSTPRRSERLKHRSE